MTLSVHRALLRLAATVAGAAACAIVIAARPDLTPVDRALPFLAILISILGWITIRLESVVFSALPILVALSVAVGDERMRLLSYGVVFGLAGVATLFGASEGRLGDFDLARGVGFVLVVTAAMRAIPTVQLSVVLLLLGVAVLSYALSDAGRVGLHVIPVVIAVGALTPITPLRVALFPSILATLILFARSGSAVSLGLAALLALLGGKWALVMILVVVATRLVFKPETRNQKPEKASSGFWFLPSGFSFTVAARVFAFAPAAGWDLVTAPRSAAAASLLLAAVAVAMRPAVSLLFALGVIAIVLPVVATRARLMMSLPSAVFVFAWVGFLAWSGALAPIFPLPTSAQPAAGHAQIVGRALASGEAYVIVPERAAPSLNLIASGSNISGLRPGTPVGRIEFADASGRGYSRDLVIGDVADWGAFRPAHFFATRNLPPENVVAAVHGYGNTAFLAGLGRVRLAMNRPIATIRVSAAPGLPPSARLELHRLELP